MLRGGRAVGFGLERLFEEFPARQFATVLLILESVAFAGVIRDAILYCNVQQRGTF